MNETECSEKIRIFFSISGSLLFFKICITENYYFIKYYFISLFEFSISFVSFCDPLLLMFGLLSNFVLIERGCEDIRSIRVGLGTFRCTLLSLSKSCRPIWPDIYPH